MKRIVYLIFALLLGLLIAAFFISSLFDFDTIEGRGSDKKAQVKWAFENAKSFNNVQDYLLLQKFDKIREKPRLSVQGKYWLEGDKYLEINDISQDVFKGKKCFGFRLEDYAIKCSIDNDNPVFVCQNSFLSKENIIPSESTIFDVVNAYDEIAMFFESYPNLSSQGLKYRGSDIPQPLRNYLETNSETQINCWVERSQTSFSKPDVFLCDKSYHKCEASPSIRIQYP